MLVESFFHDTHLHVPKVFWKGVDQRWLNFLRQYKVLLLIFQIFVFWQLSGKILSLTGGPLPACWAIPACSNRMADTQACVLFCFSASFFGRQFVGFNCANYWRWAFNGWSNKCLSNGILKCRGSACKHALQKTTSIPAFNCSKHISSSIENENLKLKKARSLGNVVWSSCQKMKHFDWWYNAGVHQNLKRHIEKNPTFLIINAMMEQKKLTSSFSKVWTRTGDRPITLLHLWRFLTIKKRETFSGPFHSS